MSTLVTGAGVIGSHTARLLADRGEQVILLDNRPLWTAIRSVVETVPVQIETGDICDIEALDALVERNGVDRIVHTAALLTSSARETPLAAIEVNVLGTANILEVARRCGVRRVVFASSTTIMYPTFGRATDTPLIEDFELRSISERATSFYAASKLSCEQFCLLYHDQFGLDVVVLRYGAVMGLWNGPVRSLPGRLALALLTPALRGEPSVIDDPMLVWSGGEEFIDVRDVAAANALALDAQTPMGRVYNVTNGTLCEFDDLVEAARQAVPSLSVEQQIQPSGGFAGFPHLRLQACDTTLARDELGFRPDHDLASSMRECARWAALLDR